MVGACLFNFLPRAREHSGGCIHHSLLSCAMKSIKKWVATLTAVKGVMRISPGMEETEIWEQYTVNLNRAPGMGFGIAVSGGKDNPHFQSGETSIVISDVLQGSPADGLLDENDRVVMVNGVSMDNVDHAFAVQQLRKSGKTAQITVRRKKLVQIPISRRMDPQLQPRRDLDRLDHQRHHHHDDDDDDEDDDMDVGFHPDDDDDRRNHRSGRSPVRSGRRSREYGLDQVGRRSRDPSVDRDNRRSWERSLDRGGGGGGGRQRSVDRSRERSLDRSRERSLDRDRAAPHGRIWSQGRSQSMGTLDSTSPVRPQRPIKVTLVKSKPSEGYGLRLGSHIYVKDIGNDGLAARDGNIQEGDIVLKINGTVTENMSLADARKLIEKSKGKLKLVVQRDERKTLTNMPELDDSPPSSDGSDHSDISDIRSLKSDRSDRSDRSNGDNARSGPRPRSPRDDRGSGQSDRGSASQPTSSVGSRGADVGSKLSKMGGVPTPFKMDDGVVPALKPVDEARATRSEESTEKAAPSSDVKPVFSQGGQPDVDLPPGLTELPNDDDQLFSPEVKLVQFKKGDSVGLRLAGGNDVGIFVAGVQDGSPAAQQGLDEGDQILSVNNVDFRNIVREEAVLYLLELPKGEEVLVHAQRKRDVYRRVVESDVGDSFYIRTHFDYEKENPYGLSFLRGEVFRVVDTLYNGKLGSWLAIRIGRNNQEVERGIIPNKNRAEQLATVQNFAKVGTNDRADFWRFRGLRSAKKNLRKSREDLSAQPVPTKFPAYERVVLREAGFLRPVVIFGPIADVARDKLAREQPNSFEIARNEPRDAGTDTKNSGVIRLHTIKEIIDKDKHALLDITPGAVDRLNYAQWYPIVLFLNPDSKSGVKTMRTRLCPESRKSARKLHERAAKLRKSNWHLFTSVINLNSMNEGWYGALKDSVAEQQNQLVWVSEGRADGDTDDLDMQDDRISHLSAPLSELSLYSDSRVTSDCEDTDTEGGIYTDQELDETMNETDTEPVLGMPVAGMPSAVSRSSEPVRDEAPFGFHHEQQAPVVQGYHSQQLQPVQSDREHAATKRASPQELDPRQPLSAATFLSRATQGQRPAARQPEEPVPLPRAQPEPQAVHRNSPESVRRPSPEPAAPKPRLPRTTSREMLAEPSPERRPVNYSTEPARQSQEVRGYDEHIYQQQQQQRTSYDAPPENYAHSSQSSHEYSYQSQPAVHVHHQTERQADDHDYRISSPYQDHRGQEFDPRQQQQQQPQQYEGRQSQQYEARPPQSYETRQPQFQEHRPPQQYEARPPQVQEHRPPLQQYDARPPQVQEHRPPPQQHDVRPPQLQEQRPPPQQYDARPPQVQEQRLPSQQYEARPSQVQDQRQPPPPQQYEVRQPQQYEARPPQQYETRRVQIPEPRSPVQHDGRQPHSYDSRQPPSAYEQHPHSRSFDEGSLRAYDEQPRSYDSIPRSNNAPQRPYDAQPSSYDSASQRANDNAQRQYGSLQRNYQQPHSFDDGDVRIHEAQPSRSQFSAAPAPPSATEPPRQATIKLPPPAPATNPPREDSDSEPVIPKSVLGRVKMFEKQQPKADIQLAQHVPPLTHAAQQSTQTYRTGEAPRLQVKPADDLRPVNRYSNSQDEDEDEAAGYRTQLGLFSRQDPPAPKPSEPPAQSAFAAHNRVKAGELESLDTKPKVADKPLDPPAGASPAHKAVGYAPPIYPKPAITQKPASIGGTDTYQSSVSRENVPTIQAKPDPPQLATKPSFPVQKPFQSVPASVATTQPSVNGSTPAPYKANPTPYTASRFTPGTAKPFQRKFDSPKFIHNLLPNDADSSGLRPSSQQYEPASINITTKPQEPPKPQFQSETMTVAPKAIPVSSSALEDESHTVLATARGVFDTHGGVLSSVETGVSIIIPKGAIPPAVEQEIYFKVCKDNSILPPLDKEKGETLLSPLVMCGPHGLKFLKPVELRLPHCEPSNWQKASDPNYKGANCVSVLIDHF
ncbi:tight junction protein 1-like isoform X1 [Petromyzon marinus]|uniref:tight junction protein 1-like isoform X1 n=3 Tax=Petromyzon marinus TaxID=7757 RepID=UPI003F70492E